MNVIYPEADVLQLPSIMEPSSAPPPRREIIVLGAGVIGLTTALKIQLQGVYNVTIIAESLPDDPLTIRYTSSWAGAHHVFSQSDNVLQHELEEMTFEVMWALSASGNEAEECFLRIPQTEYVFDHNPIPASFEGMPNFKHLEENELIPGARLGVSFTTVTIDVPIYLNYLYSRFVAKGGKLIRGSVQHINQIIEGGASVFAGGTDIKPPDAVVICVGLGARFLGGVEDKDVYPVRGQTVIVRAPWVRFGRTINVDKVAQTYVIPRRSSDVVVGGTRAPDDWYPKPRPEITRDILERAFALCPELSPPDVRAERKPTIDDVLHHVVGEGCGFRPARKGGIRLEIDWAEEVIGGRGRIPLIHNYGHSGYGYQTSWGAAVKALQLLEQALLAAEHTERQL